MWCFKKFPGLKNYVFSRHFSPASDAKPNMMFFNQIFAICFKKSFVIFNYVLKV